MTKGVTVEIQQEGKTPNQEVEDVHYISVHSGVVNVMIDVVPLKVCIGEKAEWRKKSYGGGGCVLVLS